jgi:hypothetical protein
MSVIPFQKQCTIEIFIGECADPRYSDYGESEFLVAVNESGIEYNGLIMWDGTNYNEAREIARELADDFAGRIVDFTFRQLGEGARWPKT